MRVITDTEEAESYRKHALSAASNDFERLYYEHAGNLIFKWHHYLEIYDRHLAAWRNRPLRLLELGVLHGGSLQLWRKYLGAEATIFGIDIDDRCADLASNGCEVRIGSQDDEQFLSSVVAEMGGIDIVVDDGSHIASHQRASFKHLFPQVSVGGLYFVEDLHTSYWPDWEGGLGRDGTFIESAKMMIDHMHEWYTTTESEFSSLNLRESMGAMHIYDSVVAFEKSVRSEPVAVQIGEEGLS